MINVKQPGKRLPMSKTTTWISKQTNKDIELSKTEILHEGHFKIKRHTLKFKKFSGEWSESIDREQICVANSASMILYDPKLDNIVMIEQVRIGALHQQHSPWLLEIIAGYLEPGEQAEQTVIREAKEEANCEVSKVIPIIEYYTTPGGCSERTSVFCGLCDSSHAGGVYGNEHEQEDIKVHVLPAKEVFSYLDNGMLTSSSTVIAVQWLKLNRDQLQSLGYV